MQIEQKLSNFSHLPSLVMREDGTYDVQLKSTRAQEVAQQLHGSENLAALPADTALHYANQIMTYLALEKLMQQAKAEGRDITEWEEIF